MFTSITQIRVRYGETDQMGYLYYGNYALYYEVGRTDAIRSLGLTYREVEALGVMMPVAEMNVKYIRPAYYDDLITIRTILKTMPESHKIIFHSELYNEKEELLNVGTTTLAFVDALTKKRASMPASMRQKLLPFFAEEGHH
ncbi:acyl-CoA thioester hydrolase [Chitinophaga costaii]|uniref:Acyl-CoA thioester hydrolase n=1 Tax=Chitinophaga costaii TaxID=1335309 RepID=A0A1C4FW08_9BACT|nr:thioesterase family protein [Chitinophaga costaii]PUZ27240.1 acyl-CoA thioesterase [Chitinophaga costaii]SCC59795.1 acyl-CoA thioester hydrolase [Chitinophaga costaii]